MATTPQPGVGGKVVANRRQQRLQATPYDRPNRNPSWFRGIILPSARRLASGAGRIITSILTESDSSEDDEDDASDDDANNGSHPESNALSEKLVSPSQIQGIETKQLIEKLIGQEIFSREEHDRLASVLKSRVVDCFAESGKRNFFSCSPSNAIAKDDSGIQDRAIQEAKSWFQDKKVVSTPVNKLASGNTDIYSASIDQAKHSEGSPVDVAKSYMKDRAPWASPTHNSELQTPLETSRKFLEGTSRSFSYDFFSSSKDTLKKPSGSWNIEEESKRVRSKALDDLLRASSSKVNPLSFSMALTQESLGTETEALIMKKTDQINSAVDAGLGSGPLLSALESKQDDDSDHELFPSIAAVPSKDQESVQADVGCATEKQLELHNPSNGEENHHVSHLSEINEAPTEVDSNPNITVRFSASSMPAGVDATQNSKANEENIVADTINLNKPLATIDLEVPVPMETVDDSEKSSLPTILPTRAKSKRSKQMSRRGRGK